MDADPNSEIKKLILEELHWNWNCLSTVQAIKEPAKTVIEADTHQKRCLLKSP